MRIEDSLNTHTRSLCEQRQVDPRGPVFISYRHSDGRNLAEPLTWALRAAGVPVWRDSTDLPPGDTERRLTEALNSGLSGAVLLVTPDIKHSEVVREVELPALLILEKDRRFTFVIGSTMEKASGSGDLDYSAPDVLLGTKPLPRSRPGPLRKLQQKRVKSPAERTALANDLSRRRMTLLRSDVKECGGMLILDIQTRMPPTAAPSGGHLVLRLRPPVVDERRPHYGGLRDLEGFLGQLPQLLEVAGATSVRVRGGAHLSVACALGAALPTTLVGTVEVLDTGGGKWELRRQAPAASEERLCEVVTPPVYTYQSGPVLVYLDLLPQRSDAAYGAFLATREGDFAGAIHIRYRKKGFLDSRDAEMIVGELSEAIRGLAGKHRTTEIHLLLRCPYPIALLLGRTLNTLTVHLYEWEDNPGQETALNPTYVPSVVLRSGVGGTPIWSVTAPVAGDSFERTTE